MCQKKKKKKELTHTTFITLSRPCQHIENHSSETSIRTFKKANEIYFRVSIKNYTDFIFNKVTLNSNENYI